MKFRPFTEARDYVRNLGLKNQQDWRRYCKSGRKPRDIPANPNKVYKDDWKNLGDWLGTGTVAAKGRVYRPFSEAREFVRSLQLKNQSEWNAYCKSGKKPADIPSNPNQVYEKEWKNYPDWLGTGTIASRDLHKHMRPFVEARQFVHTLNLKSTEDWKKYCDSGKKPPDIPANPRGMYKKNGRQWGIG